MSPELVPALLSFCLVATVTPGPNNMMLLASGVSFGFRQTIPHMLGVTGGVTLMALLLGTGLAGIASYLPRFYDALHLLSALYMLWLAWRIATSGGPGDGRQGGRPMRTPEAILFQWINPKAWAMVLGAISSFARPDHLLTDLPWIVATFMAVGLPCNALWTGAGTALQSALRAPRTLRLFNVAMASLLVASILPGLRTLF